MKRMIGLWLALFIPGLMLAQVEPANQKAAKEEVFMVVEEMPRFRPSENPTFQEGENDLAMWVAEHTNYPSKARKEGITGKVFIQFEVSPLGKVENAKVIRSAHPLLDAEALRVVKGLPEFAPGKQSGKNVRVSFTLPVSFKLKD